MKMGLMAVGDADGVVDPCLGSGLSDCWSGLVRMGRLLGSSDELDVDVDVALVRVDDVGTGAVD